VFQLSVMLEEQVEREYRETATVEQAISPISRSPIRLPNRPRIAAPASGARIIAANII